LKIEKLFTGKASFLETALKPHVSSSRGYGIVAMSRERAVRDQRKER